MPSRASELSNALGKTSDWGVAPPPPRCYDNQTSPLLPFRQWKAAAYSPNFTALPPFRRCEGRRARAAQAAGQMPSFSEWTQRKPSSAPAGDEARPLARYSATDSRRMITVEQMSLLGEEAELQALLRSLDNHVERHRADAHTHRQRHTQRQRGNGAEPSGVVGRQQEVAERLAAVLSRKERLAGARSRCAGSLSTERECELHLSSAALLLLTQALRLLCHCLSVCLSACLSACLLSLSLSLSLSPALGLRRQEIAQGAPSDLLWLIDSGASRLPPSRAPGVSYSAFKARMFKIHAAR